MKILRGPKTVKCQYCETAVTEYGKKDIKTYWNYPKEGQAMIGIDCPTCGRPIKIAMYISL